MAVGGHSIPSETQDNPPSAILHDCLENVGRAGGGGVKMLFAALQHSGAPPTWAEFFDSLPGF